MAAYQQPAKPQLRIISDGTGRNTQVLLGDLDITHCVESVSWELSEPYKEAKARVTFSGVLLEAASSDVRTALLETLLDQRAKTANQPPYGF